MGSWWYPTKVDCILRSLDRRLEEAGASWVSKALSQKVKSSVKAYIREDEVEACRGQCGGGGEQGVGCGA